MAIVNLTQHKATTEQVAAGVVDIEDEEALHSLVECLTFDQLPDSSEIYAKVAGIVTLAVHWQEFEDTKAAMIGGAPWLMGPLTEALKAEGIKPLFAFSTRESVEQIMPDGSIRKTAVFRHKDFVEAL